MDFETSKHAREEAVRRRIPLDLVEGVLANPDQTVPEKGDIVCYQSQVEMEGRPYLLRVMVNDATTPKKVVTVYRTSKIDKYWRSS